jgi:hypothetical protein
VSDLLGVELARPGTWPTKTGTRTFTAQHLRDAADFYTDTGGQAVPVALGHDDERFSGDPAFGAVTNIRYAEDARGPVLLGDVVDMPQWLAASAPKRWPNRSIEGWQDFEHGGRTYSLVLSGLAFLGVTPPAVRNIRSLRDLQTALAASAAQRLVASAPEGDPAAAPQTPAVQAGSTTAPTREGAVGMPDAAKLREALGLKADASDQEVTAALAAANLTGKAPDAPPPNPPTPPVPDPQPAPEPAPEPEKQKVDASAIPGDAPGTVVVSATVWAETQETIKTLKQFVDKTKRDERDQVIASAIAAGKLRPADKVQFSALWDEAPDRTRELIERMTPNSALAVMASGYAGDVEDDDFEREYAGLFPPSGKGR